MSVWQEVGDGILIRRYTCLDLTIGAVLGDDGVLLVDTSPSHRQARDLIGDLTTLTDLPVRWVVNTHYHWDHCWGNALFRTAELWGHQNTRLALLERGEDARRLVIDHLPVEHHESVREVEIVAPERTFAGRVSLDIGRAVELTYHGLGHRQRADIAAAVDLARAGFEGDLPAVEVDVAGSPFPAEVSRFVVERTYAQLRKQI